MRRTPTLRTPTLRTCVLLLAALAGIAGAARPDAVLAPDRADDDLVREYRETIRPILAKYCFDCHGPEEQKGSTRLDTLDPDFVAGHDGEEWYFALDMIEGAQMPPKKAPQWSDDERRTVVAWVRESLDQAKRAKEGTVRPVLRRLTRAQYTNTLQDLLDLDIDFWRRLPSDAKSRSGFSNNGETLQASPLHIDTYQEIARAALDEAIALGERPEATRYRVRFGEAIGKGLVAARTGGYQSVPLSTDDFLIEVLDADGRPREPVDVDEREALDRLRRKMSVGLRGSSQNRFKVTDEGLVLFGAVPHRERAPGAWQGPSPNAKLEMQRVFPEAGHLVMRVRAKRGSLWRTRDPVLLALEDAAPVASYDDGRGEVVVPDGGIVRSALSSDQRKNLVNSDDVLVPVDATQPSDSRVAVQVPSEGYYQVDLVHPPKPVDAMPSIRLSHGKLTLDLRPQLTAEQLAEERLVTNVGAAYLRAGRQHLRLGGAFFVGYSHVALTPLPADHPLVADLSAKIGEVEAAFADAHPVLRVYAGTRTDDGMDYRTFGDAQVVDAPMGEAREYTFHGRLENLPIPEPESGDTEILSGFLLLGLWNDYLVKDRRSPGPPLCVESIEVEAPYHAEWPPRSHRAIFFDSSPASVDDEDAHARAVIERFLARAFRRPTDADTVDRYHGFWRSIRADYDSFEASIKEVLVAALCSPRFLYMAEPAPTDDGAAEGIDDWSLATRLSYFLWNTGPDERLADLARAGRLRDTLDEEVERLLDDPRSRRFVAAFAEEWLRLDRLEQMTVDVGRFPDFTRFVKRDMREETVRFLHHVFTEDLSALTLIDSDFALLNQNLAEFYGIEGVAGPHFRVVDVPREAGRGGLLSHGAFLTGHSDGVQPHPIKRAVWLKEKILGDAPPPPPPNVPDLDPEAPGFAKLTLKEQLEKHRDSASCRDCHASIDPYGLAFERYSAVGLLEPERKGRPVDASTTLPDGTAVDGVAELKAHLIEHEADAVAASLIEHLFAYALGRDVSFADEDPLEEILGAVRSDGYRVRSAVREIVRSPAFLR